MRKYQIHKHLAQIFALWLFSSTWAFGQIESCTCPENSPRLSEFQQEQAFGKKFVGPKTTSVEKTKVYITTKGDQIFLLSNYYVTADLIFSTTKVFSSTAGIAIESYLQEIFSPHQIVNNKVDPEQLYEEVELILDPKILSHQNYQHLDFTSFKRLSIACPDGRKRSAGVMENASGETEYLLQYSNSISIKIKNQNIASILDQLSTRTFNYENLKIVSLVEDTKTNSYLRQHFQEKTIPFDFASAKSLLVLLQANKAFQIVLLGHIENNHFVTIDAKQHEIFSISLADLDQFQKVNNLNLLLIGCNAAPVTNGPRNSFNSLDALERLRKTKHTTTLTKALDSLSGLGGGGSVLHFVLGESFFGEQDPDEADPAQELNFDIFVQSNGGKGGGSTGGGGAKGGGGGGGGSGLPPGGFIRLLFGDGTNGGGGSENPLYPLADTTEASEEHQTDPNAPTAEEHNTLTCPKCWGFFILVTTCLIVLGIVIWKNRTSKK